MQGVLAYDIVDSSADITIIGGNLFCKVVAAAQLKKRDLKKPDRTPQNYDQRPFTLDGLRTLEITFDRRSMRTSVYVKLDAHDQLLSLEGVCWQLNIICYHMDVEP